MKRNSKGSAGNSFSTPTSGVVQRDLHPSNPVLDLARIGALSALVAVGTIISNVLFGIALPYPLGEITAAPAFYLAIAVLFSRKVSFWSTAIGSAIGETINIFVFGEAPSIFALTFVPGIVLARAPEVLIIHRFREKARRLLVFGMILATIYETVVFFLIDWPIYSFTAFYCLQPGCSSSGLVQGFWLASFDFATLVDIAWIPVALVLVVAAQRAFRVQHFD
jgi:hypothetical protein